MMAGTNPSSLKVIFEISLSRTSSLLPTNGARAAAGAVAGPSGVVAGEITDARYCLEQAYWTGGRTITP